VFVLMIGGGALAACGQSGGGGLFQTAFGESPSTTLRRSPGLGIIDPTFADSA
jgi:hypothetical protein